ncbi:hypothetical protein [Streptomyces sp. NBRC 109706]|uniref:hypothetical protein n=1 Tax=Streptomyces sp. NBRC 109706 TaxID=1550035 RepID=UPI0007824B5B|nr:hypothetical protein [Streptomyces sp. NBRC 109706]
MRRTATQTTTRTLADLLRAADRHQPVTITALKQEWDETGRPTGRLVETVRTIEIYDIHTTGAGHIIDRATGEQRSWRLDRITAYTVHRHMSYITDTPLPAITVAVDGADPEQRPATPGEVIARELSRDDDDYALDDYTALALAA